MIRRFNRYELKYVVDARRYRALCQDLLNFMAPDEYGDGDGFYRVVSLYYDSPDLSAYRSKLDGLKYRRKLRIRVYPGPDIRQLDSAFVEIKQRINRTVQKRRLVLTLGEAMRLCDGESLDKDFDEQDAAVASEVQFMVRVQSLKPTCVVSYRRRAFVGGRYERGMRLTFDMQLQGRMHALRLDTVAKNRYFLPPDSLVMEVKVNERVPGWAVALLAKHECELRRVSKYVAVVANETRRLTWAARHKESIYG